ncbi:MAG: hypothetical protein KDK99_12205 [Verrucomicrobiales bacterium]|nr:hypothetical protein [Verrucomicrobiales bacterium]
MPTRRHFLQLSAATLATAPFRSRAEDITHLSEALVPTRALTQGPKFHWFGYYDKWEFDPTDRFVLSNQVDFEGRTPTADDRIQVGMVDTENGDAWIELGKSDAWGWQQGCMLQWRPGSKNEVVWNDREDGHHVCRVKNIDTGKVRTLPRPIYALSPDGKWAVTADFARIQNLRPGYGYQGVADPYRAERCPEQSGIWRMNMETGESELIVTLASLADIPYQGQKLHDQWNYVNHLLVSPDSQRFIFLHRWRAKGPDDAGFAVNNGFVTRMFTANLDGSGRFVLDPSGYTSHFVWRDPQHVCAWTKPEGKESAFYLFKDKTDSVETVDMEAMPVNGHNTYLTLGNGQEWILNDCYPTGIRRQQIPYLYHVPTKRRIELGRFHSPKDYTGEWRCDTHPRSSHNGKKVVIDSPHGGNGRQLYLLDVSGVVG